MLGQRALHAGHASGARARCMRSLDVSKDAGDKRNEAAARAWLGRVEFVGGDFAAARPKLAGALRAFMAFEMFAELLGCLEDHAELFSATAQPEQAIRLCAAVEAVRDRLAVPRSPRRKRRWEALVVGNRAAVDRERFDAAWAGGLTVELQEAIRLAQSQPIDELALT